MNFNNATHITCKAGKCVPVNPYKFLYWGDRSVYAYNLKQDVDINNDLYNQFEAWLSQQTELHTDAKDGTYPVDEFGEVELYAKDKLNRQNPGEWFKVHKTDITQSDRYEWKFVLPYIGPNKQESEPITNSNQCHRYAQGHCNCWYLKDCVLNQPATHEQKGVEHGEELQLNKDWIMKYLKDITVEQSRQIIQIMDI